MQKRFRQAGESLEEFSRKFLVRCPRCEKCAQVVVLEPPGEEPVKFTALLFAPRRLLCLQCGYTKDWQKKVISRRTLCDWYFELPLWLQTPCCGETLWAFNEAHLDFLERYVEAELRETTSRVTPLSEKLPAWLISAKNRPEILKCLTRLRATLE